MNQGCNNGICKNCNGLILEPNKSYGYSGKVCFCDHNKLKKADIILDFAKELSNASEQLTATTQALDAAVEAISAALRLQDLWLYQGKISVEHAHEANALNLMKHRFEESLEKIKALRGVE